MIPSVPSVPCVQSALSVPSVPSVKSVPSVPSVPSITSVPSVPSIPSIFYTTRKIFPGPPVLTVPTIINSGPSIVWTTDILRPGWPQELTSPPLPPLLTVSCSWIFLGVQKRCFKPFIVGQNFHIFFSQGRKADRKMSVILRWYVDDSFAEILKLMAGLDCES